MYAPCSDFPTNFSSGIGLVCVLSLSLCDGREKTECSFSDRTGQYHACHLTPPSFAGMLCFFCLFSLSILRCSFSARGSPTLRVLVDVPRLRVAPIFALVHPNFANNFKNET